MTYPADAGPDRDLCLGDSIQLGTHTFSDYFYTWTGSDGSIYKNGMPWVKPGHTTTYTLKQKDFKFDESISTVTVYVEECENELTVPNVFTPNQDVFNDELKIINKKGFLYTLDIYDRWGRKVFSGNQNVNWDGRASLLSGGLDNQLVATGVYYYNLRATTREGNKLEYSGAVQVVR